MSNLSTFVLFLLAVTYLLNRFDAQLSDTYSYDGNWFIQNETFEQMFEFQIGQKYTSPPFEINESKWKVVTYPNGFNNETEGSFMVYIYLIDMPLQWKQIIASYTIKCPQTTSKYSQTKKTDSSGNAVWGWWSKSLLLKEIKQLNLTYFELMVHINILKIISNNNTEKILYQYPLIYKNKYHIKWEVDVEMVNQMKNASVNKIFESMKYYDMWCIDVYPDGTTYKNNEGFVNVYLKLISLPMNAWIVPAEFTITCIQTKTTQTFTADFKSGGTGFGWSDKALSFAEFKQYSNITFVVDINIWNIIDKNGNILFKHHLIIDQISSIESRLKELSELLKIEIKGLENIDKNYKNKLQRILQSKKELNDIEKELYDLQNNVKMLQPPDSAMDSRIIEILSIIDQLSDGWNRLKTRIEEIEMVNKLKEYEIEHIWIKLKECRWIDITIEALRNMNIEESDIVKFQNLQNDMNNENEIIDSFITVYSDNAKLVNAMIICVITAILLIYIRGR